MPLLTLPPISARSLRIPAIRGDCADSSSPSLPSSSSSPRGVEDSGGGGGARKEATPQSRRVRVSVSSEMSSLTPRRLGVSGCSASSESGSRGRNPPGRTPCRRRGRARRRRGPAAARRGERRRDGAREPRHWRVRACDRAGAWAKMEMGGVATSRTWGLVSWSVRRGWWWISLGLWATPGVFRAVRSESDGQDDVCYRVWVGVGETVSL